MPLPEIKQSELERPSMRHLAVVVACVLIAGAFSQSTRAQTFGDRPGEISTGHCRCKDQCETGQSIFSQGRSVAQCKHKCQQAFSGCTKGEVRSNQRRD
jgi:hypothetical protein